MTIDDGAETGVGETVLADPVVVEDPVLAWATVPDSLLELERHERRGERWRWAAAIVLVCAALLAVATLFMMGYRASSSPPSTPPARSVPALRPAPNVGGLPDPPPSVMPSAAAEKETADGHYLTMMNHIPGRMVDDPAKAISYGHGVCRGMEHSGDSIGEATTQIEKLSQGSGWSDEQVHALVMAAVSAYCPQFMDRP